MMRYMLLVALLASACGGSSTAPTPPPIVTPTPTTITLSGTVHATNGGQPLPGVQAALGSIAAMTDGAGAFTAQMPPAGSLSLALTGSGIVPRTLYVAAGSSRSVTVDAISTSGFDLNFYRQMVRNGFDAPATLQPLRRWTRNPSIYLKTVDEAGEPIHGPTVDMVEATARAIVPLWTAGRFTATVERGTGTREGVAGWITIKWPATATPGRCGTAQVGLEGGWVELEYHGGATCRCQTTVMSPRTVRHELGHAMGFWHTDSTDDIMNGGQWAQSQCDTLPSARELAAAAIAYQRPVGNMDPDADRPGTVNLAPMRVR